MAEGIEAGQADHLRRCGLVAVATVFAFLRRHRLHPFVIGFTTMIFALGVVHCALAIFYGAYCLAGTGAPSGSAARPAQ